MENKSILLNDPKQYKNMDFSKTKQLPKKNDFISGENIKYEQNPVNSFFGDVLSFGAYAFPGIKVGMAAYDTATIISEIDSYFQDNPDALDQFSQAVIDTATKGR